jgi:hypothetical protein
MGRLCYPTKAQAESWYFSQKTVTVQGGYGACFCRLGTNLIEHYACRGTSLIGAGKLSRYRIFFRGTGAVSRYKLSRSQKSVTVQDLNCGQMRVSGCKNYYKFVLGAGAKAKTVTNNLPILSVLGVRNSFLNVKWIGVFELDYFTFSNTKIESDLLIKSPISIFEPLREK